MDANLFNGLPIAGGAQGIRELEEMKKALTAGYNLPTYTGSGTGGALLRQDLSSDLIMQTELAEDVKFWQSIYKPDDPVQSTVFEYRRQNSLGERGPMSFWNSEGVLGSETDSGFEFATEKCAFLSEARSVTIPMAELPILGPTPDAVAKVSEDAMLHMLTRLEDGLFNGDKGVDSDSINGLIKAADDAEAIDGTGTHVVDRRGATLDPNQVAQYAIEMREGTQFARANQLWTSFGVRRTLGTIIADSIRRQLGGGQRPEFDLNGIARKLPTDVGDIDLEGSIYLSEKRWELASTASGGETAPATPALTSVVAGAPGAGETSNFVAADAGDYTYRLVAVGAKGFSVVDSSATTVAAGEKVTVTVTAPSSAAKFYVLYRTQKNGTRFWRIATKAQTMAGASPAPTVFTDLNNDLPGTTSCYLIENSPRTMRWRKLMGFSRIDLPIPAGTLKKAYAFALMGAFLVTKPRAVVRFKNVAVA